MESRSEDRNFPAVRGMRHLLQVRSSSIYRHAKVNPTEEATVRLPQSQRTVPVVAVLSRAS